MSAMFLGKRTRPEILIALSLLGSRVENPDNFDLMCLHKVYKYLACNPEYGLRFKPLTMTLHYWVDAAYGTHVDDNMKSHTGIATTIGYNNAPVFVRSRKQKLTTRSSTEAELVALDNDLLHLLWFSQVLGLMGYAQSPAYMYQDNKSTIFVCETGLSKSGKLKHMAMRYYFIQSHAIAGTICGNDPH